MLSLKLHATLPHCALALTVHQSSSLSHSLTRDPYHSTSLGLPISLPLWVSLKPSLTQAPSYPSALRSLSPSLRLHLTVTHSGSLTLTPLSSLTLTPSGSVSHLLTYAPFHPHSLSLPHDYCHSGCLPPSLIVISLSPSVTQAPSHTDSLGLPLLPHCDLALSLHHSGSLSP